MEFKREVIEYAEMDSNHKEAKRIMLLLKKLGNGEKRYWKYFNQ